MKVSLALTTLLVVAAPSLGQDDPVPPKQFSPIFCGGHTPEPRLCPQGQVCAPTQPPGTADFPGECVLQRCGGFVLNPTPCPQGQVCVYNHTVVTDTPGWCLSPKLRCGSPAGSAKCKSGWDCIKRPQIDWVDYVKYWGEDGNKGKGEGICAPPGALTGPK